MKKITQSLSISERIKYQDIFLRYARGGDCYVTIETTGLSPERHRIISFSLATVTDEAIAVTTFFSDNKDDELTIIENGLDAIGDEGRIITWNGDSFDLRFLSARGEEYGIKSPVHTSYDLKKIFSPLKRFIASGSLSLYDTLEEMGISDDSVPDGKTLVTLYKTFIETGEKRYSEPVLQHSVYKLTGIMNLMCLHSCLNINKAVPTINESSVTDETLNVSGSTDLFFPTDLHIGMDGIDLFYSENRFNARFTLYDGRIRMYFPDPASYVRLRSDGSLIPKELSRSMSKDSYERVSKESCFSLVKIPQEKKQLENYIMSLEKM